MAESPGIKSTMDDVARRSATDACRSAIGQPSGGSAARAQISSTTVCPESNAPTILSKDTENAASKSSFRQLPNRTHRNRPASCGWLLR